MAFKHNNPGCPCCESCNFCWSVTKCNGRPAAGAVIKVTVNGSVVATLTTDSQGHACSDLTPYNGKSLSFAITYLGYQTYTSNTFSGNYCRVNYAATLSPPVNTECWSCCDTPGYAPPSLTLNDPLTGNINVTPAGTVPCGSYPFPVRPGSGNSIYGQLFDVNYNPIGYGWSWGPLGIGDGLTFYRLQCLNGLIQLTFQKRFMILGFDASYREWICGQYAPSVMGGSVSPLIMSGMLTPTTLSCSPFAATFNLPSTPFNCYIEQAGIGSGIAGLCTTQTLPAHTITIHE